MSESTATTPRVLLTRVATWGLWVGMALLALIALLVISQVAARNFFNAGLPWADELARFCSIALVNLTVPLLLLRREMVAVTLVPDMLSGRHRRWQQLVVDLCVVSFGGLMLYGFVTFLPRAGKFTQPATGMPNYVFYAPAMIGCVLLTLIALLLVYEAMSGRIANATAADGKA
jgi:TRAP-type C4-dicarboxylate transport system permease small subunit